MKLLITLFAVFVCAVKIQAQETIKYGKIDAADFDVTSSMISSDVNAIVLADIGSSEFEGNNKGWFTLVFKRIRRVKILNLNGADAANFKVRLYTDNGYYEDRKSKEELVNLKATTYNLENGSIIKTELDSKTVFEDRLSRNWVEKKFTMPAVKAGSIIEFSYTINSDYIFNLQPWYFQGKYPCLWSEYTVKIPDCFSYVTLSTGYNPYTIKTAKLGAQVYRIEDIPWKKGEIGSNTPDVFMINANVGINRWAIKNVPAVKEEDMVSATNNYISKIEFQLSKTHFTTPPEDKMHNWLTVSKEFMLHQDFGFQIDNATWLKPEVDKLVNDQMTDDEKARTIYAFVRDNFTCTGNGGIFLTPDTYLRTIYKQRKGTVSDINLMLTSMIKQAGIRTDPVILSTRNHGFVHPVYPILDKYNYVITRVKTNDHTYLLDASNRFLGFNRLSKDCYNGLARVISIDTATLKLYADSLKETSYQSLFVINNESKNGYSGTFSTTYTYDESVNLRSTLSSQQIGDYIKNFALRFPQEIRLSDVAFDSLHAYDVPLNMHYNFAIDFNNAERLYINPLFGNALKENPFKGDSRRMFPIEMPYCTDDVFTVNMEVPQGYKTEELPKSARINLPDNAGFFEYIIQQSGERIQLKSRIKIDKTVYGAEDYEMLKDFYSNILKKQSEQIVFYKNPQ